MLLADIQHRCTELGKSSIYRRLVDDTDIDRSTFLARVERMRDGLARLGVGEGCRIGLSLPNSGDLLTAIAIVATWSASASFVPLDPREPRIRREAILRQAQLAAVVTPQPANDLLDAGILTVAVADGEIIASAGRTSEQQPSGRPEYEAYVIFTSGSTGSPKGVSVSHASIASYIGAARKAYAVPEAGMLIHSQLPPTFDASLTTLLLPLVTSNIALPIADPSSATRALAAALRGSSDPFLLKTTPSQARLLGQLLTEEDRDHLEARGGTIIIGGETLDFADLSPFRRPGIQIFN
jgi:non-ribosomal peptide synthetase component F